MRNAAPVPGAAFPRLRARRASSWSAEGPSDDEEQTMFTVMTWNVENLFRAGTEFGPKTQAAYTSKLGQLAATIDAIAPDFVAVQEVGSPAALDDLVEGLSADWSAVLAKNVDQRGLRVAALTRQPVIEAEDVADFPSEV